MKLFNGRGDDFRRVDDERWPSDRRGAVLFIAAASREDARRVVEEYCGRRPSYREAASYWSPCWGRRMEGVEPHRGLWVSFGYDGPPVLLYDGRTKSAGEPRPCAKCGETPTVGAALAGWAVVHACRGVERLDVVGYSTATAAIRAWNKNYGETMR